MFKVEFLPSAEQDMLQITEYIAVELSNIDASKNLIRDLRKATDLLKTFPKAHPVYPTPKPLKRKYRRAVVKNYSMFYYIDGESVKIKRVLYNRQNLIKILSNE